MPTRLVLGCGAVGRRIVETARPDVLVIAGDATVVEALREDGVRAMNRDPGRADAIADLDPPAVVLVADDRPAVNRQALENVAERFPDAVTIAIAPGEPDESAFHDGSGPPAASGATGALADVVLDPRTSLSAALVDAVASTPAHTAIALRRVLRTIEGRLAVVTHDNPDPDAIASAVALVEIARSLDIEAEACYFGEISHQENRAMVNLLELDLRHLEAGETLADFGGVALVDHSRPGVNDGLPEDTAVDVVVDHHPPRGPVAGRFVDIRPEAGATSTIMAEYLERFGLAYSRRTATALLYGLRIDTGEFTREVDARDFDAAARLLPHVDAEILRKIESPTVSGETLETVARAIKRRDRRGEIVVSSAGPLGERDALPQAADQLLNLEGVTTSVVFGFLDDQAILSARSRSRELDLGEVVRDAYAAVGSAGGHADMAGAQLDLGVLGDDEGETALELAEEAIAERFFEAVELASRPAWPPRSVHPEW